MIRNLGVAGLAVLLAAALVAVSWGITLVVGAMVPPCAHTRVRCTHGDEIVMVRGRRRVCLDCGRSLDGPLPDPCHQTGEPHRGGT